jgi:hypothetical protein
VTGSSSGHRTRRRDLASAVRNWALRPVGRLLADAVRSDRWPVVLIVSPPRAGSTLLYALGARCLDVTYLPNRLASWWISPTLGLWGAGGPKAPASAVSLESDYGRSDGPDGPHEFGWFWRHYLPLQDDDALDRARAARADWSGLRRELEGLAGVHQRPVWLKNLNAVCFNLASIAEHVPSACFLRIRRDPLAVALSILSARERERGSTGSWWSIRPPGWQRMQREPPESQVAWQVLQVERALDRSLPAVGPRRGFSIEYAQLTEAPTETLGTIAAHFGLALRWGGVHQGLDVRRHRRAGAGGDPRAERVREAFAQWRESFSAEDAERPVCGNGAGDTQERRAVRFAP